ncbi:MAG: pyridoxal 5'-phosphate synthase glutaminase subunit PdxT [Candidatus Izemoplasma sp.]|nr:pyridoxal 5'-phosphate synthase glutaminase subunit PdxT [Candidatus Izemoplasma sp.]
MHIGILALQGAFIEHAQKLKDLGVDSFEIRKLDGLKQPMDGLIIPGGESTTMYKLLVELNMVDTIKQLIQNGLPVFGTCAGLILLANDVENYKQSFLQTMNITARKNAYGRQLGSFRSTGQFDQADNIPFVFIRAPYITQVGPEVEVLSNLDDHIIAARQGNQLVTAFHPELTSDHIIHQYFVNMCEDYKKGIKKAE